MKYWQNYAIIATAVLTGWFTGCSKDTPVEQIYGNVVIESLGWDETNNPTGDTIVTQDADSIKVVLMDGTDSVLTTYTIEGNYSFEEVLPGDYHVTVIITNDIVEESDSFNAEAGQIVNCPDIVFGPYAPDVCCVYPNPFSTQLHFGYTLQEHANVTLKMYNCKGTEIEKLVDGYCLPGVYHVVWNGENNPAGVYFFTFSYNSALAVVNAVKEN